MANKLLNLKLSYKGKQLDVIRQGVDFTGVWYIGSDRRIFWQILDDTNKFPLRHKFLVKQGQDYLLQIPPGSTLSCNKDGKPVDAGFLQQNGILSHSNLKLRNDMSGKIQLNENYDIQYAYAEPVPVILGPRENAVVLDASHTAPLSNIERTNRGLIILSLILTIAFILVYDLVIRPEKTRVQTLSELLADLEKAQRIDYQSGQEPIGAESQVNVDDSMLPQDQAEQAQTKPNQPRGTTPGRPNAEQTFGLNRSGNKPGASSGAQQANILVGFTAAKPGSMGSTGQNGNGIGPNSFVPSASSGYSGTFSPEAISGFNHNSNPGAIATGTPPPGGSINRPSGAVSYTNDAGKLVSPYGDNYRPRVTAPNINGVISAPKVPDTAPIVETNIIPVTPSGSSAPGIDNIYDQLSPRKGQIKQAYQRNAAQKRQSGSVTVRMNIADNGSVRASVTANSSTFTQTFLNEIKTIVEKWSFRVSKPTVYEFRINLSQS